jgi:hypothetical protein
MYAHRHQQKIGNMIGLAWQVLFANGGGARVVFFYMIMHLSGWADRKGWRRLSDWLRLVSMEANERAVGAMLQTRFCFEVMAVGGCGIDVDNEEEYAAVQKHFERWSSEQARLAEEIYGPVGLPARVPAERHRLGGPRGRIARAGDEP